VRTDDFYAELDRRVRERFRFLEEDYGFRRGGWIADSDATYRVRYRKARTGIQVSFDVPENDLVVQFVKLQPALFGRAKFPSYLETAERNWVAVGRLAHRRGGSPLLRPREEGSLDVNRIDEWLEETGQTMKEYCDDVLRGDFAEFDAEVAESREASARGPIYPHTKTSTPTPPPPDPIGPPKGMGEVRPDVVRGWNWGAFLMTWAWGWAYGKRLYALLALVPGLNFVMAFVFGFKGNEWAWQHKSWPDEESFREAQRRWVYWGLGIWAIGAPIAVFKFLS
jgi:hypothetical protein